MRVLSFDQSYTNFGYSFCNDGKIEFCGSIRLAAFKGKVIKRKYIETLVFGLTNKFKPDTITIEQLRLFNKSFINLDSISSLVELASCIQDSLYPKKIYTIDTRSWKAKVLNNSKADKEDAVSFVKENFGLIVDHDCADAICMSLYPGKKGCKLNLYE